MVAATAFSARSGWSVCSGIRWSVSRGTGGQFAPESGGQYQRILQQDALYSKENEHLTRQCGPLPLETGGMSCNFFAVGIP